MPAAIFLTGRDREIASRTEYESRYGAFIPGLDDDTPHFWDTSESQIAENRDRLRQLEDERRGIDRTE